MSERAVLPHEDKHTFKNEFGVFYPIGYLIAAFDTEDNARQVRRDLMTGGFDQRDCQLYTADEVAAGARANYGKAGILSKVGASADRVHDHLEAAEQGATFLVVYAPTEVDTERVMTVCRRTRFRFVHRYRRFVIEHMR